MFALQAWASRHSGFPPCSSFLPGLLWHFIHTPFLLLHIKKQWFFLANRMDPAHPFKLAPQLLARELLLPLPLEGSESSIFLKTVAWYIWRVSGSQVVLIRWLILERVPEKVRRVFRSREWIQYKLPLWRNTFYS